VAFQNLLGAKEGRLWRRWCEDGWSWKIRAGCRVKISVCSVERLVIVFFGVLQRLGNFGGRSECHG